jgi:hypothetical protein
VAFVNKKQKCGVVLLSVSVLLMGIIPRIPLPEFMELALILLAILLFAVSAMMIAIQPLAELEECPVCKTRRFKPLFGKPAKYCWKCGHKFE